MGKFGDFLNDNAGAIGGVLGAGMGLLFEGHNDRRQRRQQQALTDIQVNANKKLADYNYLNQLKLWEATNYSAQKDQLKKAGLNPGLIYGMSGGGGATTAAAQAGPASGASAQGSSNEAMGIMMNKAQLEMMQAQIDNINADTNLKDVNANKTGGVDTTLAWTNVSLLKQQIKNAEAQEALTKVETAIAKIQKQIQEQTEPDQVKMIDMQAQVLQQQLFIIRNDREISDETKEAAIKEIKANAVNAVIQGEAMRSGIAVNNANINRISVELSQNWANLNIQARQQVIQGAFLQKQIDMATIDRIITGIGGLGNLIGNVKKGGSSTYNTNNYIPAAPTPIK